MRSVASCIPFNSLPESSSYKKGSGVARIFSAGVQLHFFPLKRLPFKSSPFVAPKTQPKTAKLTTPVSKSSPPSKNALNIGLLLCLGVNFQLCPVNLAIISFSAWGCTCIQCTPWLRLWRKGKFLSVADSTIQLAAVKPEVVLADRRNAHVNSIFSATLSDWWEYRAVWSLNCKCRYDSSSGKVYERFRWTKLTFHWMILCHDRCWQLHFANTIEKLGYRRDSARRLSLCRPGSFKVTNFGTNRKFVCDFVLVNGTMLSRTVCQVSRSIDQIIAFDYGVLLFNAFVLRNICEYCRKSCIAKNLIIWSTFLSQTVWV